MKIVQRTNHDYAHIKLETKDEKRIRTLEEKVLKRRRPEDPLKGFRIEVSKDDLVPEEIKSSLIDGKFFVVQ